VHEVVRDVDAFETRSERGRIQAIARDDVNGRRSFGPQIFGPAGKATDTLAAFDDRAQEATANVSRRAGDEDERLSGIWLQESSVVRFCVRKRELR